MPSPDASITFVSSNLPQGCVTSLKSVSLARAAAAQAAGTSYNADTGPQRTSSSLIATGAPRRSQTSAGLTNQAGNVLQHVVLLFHALSGERDGSAATLGSLADVASWRKSVLASRVRLMSLQATCLLDRSSGWLSGQLFCCGRPSLLPTGPPGDSRGKHRGAIASCATACPLSSLPGVELACGRRLALLAQQRGFSVRACAKHFGGEPSPLKILAVLQVHAGVRTPGLPTLHATQSLL